MNGDEEEQLDLYGREVIPAVAGVAAGGPRARAETASDPRP